jgi:hypothetical protein
MTSAKDIRVAPVTRSAADACIMKHHYSGNTLNNTALHFGVFLGDVMHGALQFGPSLDKRKMQPLVRDTSWNGFIELNRMALGPELPRNSESRALAVAFRLIRKHYPHIEWVVSFSDGTQCGDGAIYRASGFVLTGIKRNTQIVEFPDGLQESRIVLTDSRRPRRFEVAKRYGIDIGGGTTLKPFLDIGARMLPGFQLRYVYFLNPAARERLTVPILPFSAIDDAGARMYKGKPTRSKQATVGTTDERQCNADPGASTQSEGIA